MTHCLRNTCRVHLETLISHLASCVHFQVDLLPEITMTPLFRPPSDSLLPASLRAEVQSYITTRQPSTFPSTLAARMALSPTDALLCEAKYNVPLLNAFVFHVGLTVSHPQPLCCASDGPDDCLWASLLAPLHDSFSHADGLYRSYLELLCAPMLAVCCG